MAKLYRNATTRDYYTKTRIKGEFVTLQIDNDGKNFLLQNGVVTGRVIPPEMMSTLWSKGWLYTRGEYPHIFSATPGAPVQQPLVLGSFPVNDSRNLRNIGKQLELPRDIRNEPRTSATLDNVERIESSTSSMKNSVNEATHVTSTDDTLASVVRDTDERGFRPNNYVWLAIAAIVVIAVWMLLQVS